MRLETKKLKKMIRNALKGDLILPEDAFNTLIAAYLSSKKLEFLDTPKLHPPPIPIVRISPKTPPKKSNFIEKLASEGKDVRGMAKCREEMTMSPRFLEQKKICDISLISLTIF